MSIADSVCGMVKIRISCADITHFLHCLTENRIMMKNVAYVNELETILLIRRTRLGVVRILAESNGAQIEIIEQLGFATTVSQLKSRSFLLLGVAAYLFIVCFLPSKVLFVHVVGNSYVSTQSIIENAERAGVCFGTDRKDLRSEHIKNILLNNIPSLEWAGVNTVGCVAIITVKEKNSTATQPVETGVCSIVASCDGIIDSVTVTKGSQQCKVGQEVKKDQVLVSGYVIDDNRIKLTSAKAEIYALTTREITALIPLQQVKRTAIQDININYSLIFQKKEIKLQKGSGISGGECVKMYSKYTLTLPGGFQLPFSVVKETEIVYGTELATVPEKDACRLTEYSALRTLQETMVAGVVLSSTINTQYGDSILTFHGKYLCREMISKVYEEEIITGNE